MRPTLLISYLVLVSLTLACGKQAETSTAAHGSLTVNAGLTCDKKKKNQQTMLSSRDTYSCVGGTYPGTEYVATLTPKESGEIVVAAGKFDWYPMMIILHDTGTGVDGAECVAGNWYSVRFDAVADETYYVVVESDGIVPNVNFDVKPFCKNNTVETKCKDGMDDDGDWLFDCDDPDCDTSQDCQVGGMCSPSVTLSCGDRLVAGVTEGFGTGTTKNYLCTGSPILKKTKGSERTYIFNATVTEEVVFTVSNFDEVPLLLVLEDEGNGCDPGACNGYNYYSKRFLAEAGKTYYLIVDGQDKDSFLFHASLVCGAPQNESECASNVDEDGDTLVDCFDPDCAGAPQCAGGSCVPTATLDCNTQLLHGDTADAAATDAIGTYSCAPTLSLGTPEMSYQVGPFNTTTDVLVTLSNETGYAVVSVLQDTGAGCDSSECVVENYYNSRFTAQAGVTYYVVVEADYNPTVAFDLSVVCNPPARELGAADCSDGIDNDGDFLIDCDDTDCTAECGLTTMCSSVGTLDCNTVLLPGSVSDPGATNTTDSYSCNPQVQLTGSEYAYTFVAPADGYVNFTLSDETWYAGIAVLDSASCDPNTCVDFQYYSVVTSVTQGETYTVVVDALDNSVPLDYSISVVCDPPLTETNCSDNIDNDGDFLIDCDDIDCGC